jgi:hypothetical protein
MKGYTTFFKTIRSTDIKKFETQIQHYLSISYYIVSGNIIATPVVKSYFPLRIETQYTAFLQKSVKLEDGEMEEGE